MGQPCCWTCPETPLRLPFQTWVALRARARAEGNDRDTGAAAPANSPTRNTQPPAPGNSDLGAGPAAPIGGIPAGGHCGPSTKTES